MENNDGTKGVEEMNEGYLTIKEAADLYGCTYANMYTRAKNGSIEKLEVGGKAVVRKEDVIALRDKKGSRSRKKKVKEVETTTPEAKTDPVEEVVKTEPVEESTEPVEPEKVEEVSTQVPVPMSIPKPPVITEVEIGTELVLVGKILIKEPTDEAYVAKDVDDITAEVIARHPAGEDGVWLVCQPANSPVYLAVKESEVLSGKYQMLTPEEKVALRNTEMEEDLKKFRGSLKVFADARDTKLGAEKAFKKIEKVERPSIEEYVRKYGKESGEGKGDFQVFEMGYKTHIIRTPGKAITSYKESQMLEWLMANGHDDCIKMVPNIDMWKNLKAAEKVPADIIAELEEMSISDDRFSLTIKKSDD